MRGGANAPRFRARASCSIDNLGSWRTNHIGPTPFADTPPLFWAGRMLLSWRVSDRGMAQPPGVGTLCLPTRKTSESRVRPQKHPTARAAAFGLVPGGRARSLPPRSSDFAGTIGKDCRSATPLRFMACAAAPEIGGSSTSPRPCPNLRKRGKDRARETPFPVGHLKNVLIRLCNPLIFLTRKDVPPWDTPNVPRQGPLSARSASARSAGSGPAPRACRRD